MYARRFCQEHGYRFMKQELLWDKEQVRTPEQYERWSLVVALVHNQLVLARELGHATQMLSCKVTSYRDSLALEKEPIIVGHAASYFTYTEFFDIERLPSREESQAFIADYEVARGKQFTPDERKTLDAAMIYGLPTERVANIPLTQTSRTIQREVVALCYKCMCR